MIGFASKINPILISTLSILFFFGLHKLCYCVCKTYHIAPYFKSLVALKQHVLLFFSDLASHSFGDHYYALRLHVLGCNLIFNYIWLSKTFFLRNNCIFFSLLPKLGAKWYAEIYSTLHTSMNTYLIRRGGGLKPKLSVKYFLKNFAFAKVHLKTINCFKMLWCGRGGIGIEHLA